MERDSRRTTAGEDGDIMTPEDEYKCDHCGKQIGTEDEPAHPRMGGALCGECFNARGMVYGIIYIKVKPRAQGIIS